MTLSADTSVFLLTCHIPSACNVTAFPPVIVTAIMPPRRAASGEPPFQELAHGQANARRVDNHDGAFVQGRGRQELDHHFDHVLILAPKRQDVRISLNPLFWLKHPIDVMMS